MTRAPWVTEKPARAWAKPGASFDTSIGWRFPNPRFDESTTLSMPQTAEQVAQRWNLTRAELDEFALLSHQRAVEGDRERTLRRRDRRRWGRSTPTRDRDPTPASSGWPGSARSTGPTGSSPPATPARSTTAPRRWSIASEAYVDRHGLQPRARVVAAASAGVAPGDHGHRAGARHPEGTRTRRLVDRRPRRGRAQRGLRLPGARLHPGPGARLRDGQRGRRSHRPGTSARRIRLADPAHPARAAGAERCPAGLATMCVGVGQGTALLVERA